MRTWRHTPTSTASVVPPVVVGNGSVDGAAVGAPDTASVVPPVVVGNGAVDGAAVGAPDTHRLQRIGQLSGMVVQKSVADGVPGAGHVASSAALQMSTVGDCAGACVGACWHKPHRSGQTCAPLTQNTVSWAPENWMQAASSSPRHTPSTVGCAVGVVIATAEGCAVVGTALGEGVMVAAEGARDVDAVGTEVAVSDGASVGVRLVTGALVATPTAVGLPVGGEIGTAVVG
jgi:hypothetical protein